MTSAWMNAAGSPGFRFRRLADTSTPESPSRVRGRHLRCREQTTPCARFSCTTTRNFTYDQYGARTKPPRYQRQPVSYTGWSSPRLPFSPLLRRLRMA